MKKRRTGEPTLGSFKKLKLTNHYKIAYNHYSNSSRDILVPAGASVADIAIVQQFFTSLHRLLHLTHTNNLIKYSQNTLNSLASQAYLAKQALNIRGYSPFKHNKSHVSPVLRDSNAAEACADHNKSHVSPVLRDNNADETSETQPSAITIPASEASHAANSVPTSQTSAASACQTSLLSSETPSTSPPLTRTSSLLSSENIENSQTLTHKTRFKTPRKYKKPVKTKLTSTEMTAIYKLIKQNKNESVPESRRLRSFDCLTISDMRTFLTIPLHKIADELYNIKLNNRLGRTKRINLSSISTTAIGNSALTTKKVDEANEAYSATISMYVTNYLNEYVNETPKAFWFKFKDKAYFYKFLLHCINNNIQVREIVRLLQLKQPRQTSTLEKLNMLPALNPNKLPIGKARSNYFVFKHMRIILLQALIFNNINGYMSDLAIETFDLPCLNSKHALKEINRVRKRNGLHPITRKVKASKY